jgi:GntR family transcriptional regulator
VPLTISVQRTSNVSIYRQIVEQVCAAVLTGQLREGERLPSVRSLSGQIRVNPNTVSRAWRELVRASIVEARPGRVMLVSRRRRVYGAAERARRMDDAVASLMSDAFILGFTRDQILKRITIAVRAQAETKAAPGANYQR